MSYTSFLLAQADSNTGLFAALTGLAFMVAILFFGMVMLVRKQYKRCPSNRVLVIYGGRLGKSGAAKTIHGGSAFVMPLIQDYAYLSLEPIQIEVPQRGALSAENI